MMVLVEIQNCLKSDDEEIRRSALLGLRGLPLNESRDLIFSAMGDESWRVRKESVEAFVAAAPDEAAIVKLLELLRNEDNAGLRNSAAEAVVRLGTAAAMPLIGLIDDQDADVRKFIVDLMGAIGDPAFVDPVLNSLGDADVNVAAAAAEHLGSIGDDRVIPELVQAIAANPAELFRFSALEALSVLAKPSLVPQEILMLAEQDILSKAVYDCLGSISDDSSLPLLVKGLASPRKGNRSAAVKAIFKIHARSAADVKVRITDALRTMNGGEVITGFLNLPDIRDPNLSEALIWLSDTIGDIRFVSLLMVLFEDERCAEAALTSLKQFGTQGLMTAISWYPEAHENARCALCTLIGEAGNQGHCELIKTACTDNSSRVRESAAAAAARLGMNVLIPDLAAMTGDADAGVSSAAVSSLIALALIDHAGVSDIARHFSVSKDLRQRRHAAMLFAALEEHEGLLLLAKDENPTVRSSAVSAIGGLNIKSLESTLLMSLADEDPDVRISAADALGKIEAGLSLDALEQALDDEDMWVRCAVLKAISRIDRGRVLTIIKRVHAASEGLFLITCLQLLESCGDQEAQFIISSCLENPDPDIARQACASLQRLKADKQCSGSQ